MKVLLDATAIPADLGGVGRYVDDLVPELINAGVNLALAVQERDAAHFRAKAPRAHLFPVPGLLTNRGARMAWEQTGLPALIGRIRPDLLHSPHYTFPALHRVPVVVTLHDATFFTHPGAHSRLKRRFFTAAIRRAVRRADALVVPSAATRDETLRFVDGDPARFHIAHHGVDTSVFHPVDDAERERVAASLGLAGRRYIGFLGTLKPWHGLPLLVEAFARLHRRFPQTRLLVVGDGPGRTDMESSLTALGLLQHCRFTGAVQAHEVPGLLAQMDIATAPYPAQDNFYFSPLKIYEYLAAELPVVTTRVGHLATVVLQDVDGLLVPPGDPDAFADALATLVQDPALRLSMGRRGRQRIVAEHSWDAVTARILAMADAAMPDSPVI